MAVDQRKPFPQGIEAERERRQESLSIPRRAARPSSMLQGEQKSPSVWHGPHRRFDGPAIRRDRQSSLEAHRFRQRIRDPGNN